MPDGKQPRYWVATYGDMGIEVAFYHSPLAYGRAIQRAKSEHEYGNLDTYTHGRLADETLAD